MSVAVDGAVAGTAAAGESTSVAVAAGSAVVLTADPDDGWRLSEWTLSGGNGSLECVEGPLSSNPCTLATGSLTADASATATFEAVFALTVSAGEGGSVAVAVDGAAAGAAAAGESTSVVVTALSAVVLTAVATAGHSFDSWTLSGGSAPLECAEGPLSPNPCTLATGSFTAAASASAAFEVVTYRLEAVAGAGGSVNVMIDGASAGRASAGTTEGFSVDVRSVVELAAVPDPGWRLLSWTLSGGNDMLACTGLSCPFALAAGSFTADASATATFEVLTYRLTAGAGAGGRVTVTVAAGGDSTEVGAAMTRGFDVDVRSAVELEAFPDDGQSLVGWTLSGGNGMLSCAAVRTCTLAAGSFTADASASAAFEAIPHRLEAGAGAGGRVNVMIGGVSAGGASAGTTGSFSVAAGSAVVLTAVHAAGWAFSAWTLSGGNGSLECAEGPLSSPCTLAADSLTADSSASAAFEATPYRLEAGAGAGGRVNVMIDGVSAGGASAGTTGSFSVDVRSTVELEAVPDAGQGLAGWTLSGGNGSLECAPDPDPNSCTLAARSFTDDASASAAFAADLSLAVSAGAGGRVTVAVGGGAPVTVDAGESTDVAVAVGSAVALTAIPADSNVFAGWTGACAGAGARCELAAGGSAAATFGNAAMTLAVSAGAGGGVDVAIGQAAARTVGAGRESTYVVAAASAAVLTARPGFGRLFDSWTPLGELDLPCADPAAAVCELAAGSASGGAAAAFGTRQSALTVSAGDDGSVTVAVDGADARTVTAGSSTDVAVTVDDAVALAAMPDGDGDRFVRWALSDGLACRDGPEASPCMLAPVGADGSADAEFSPLPSAVSWTGPGAVEEDGLALTAVPYADGAFEEWQGAPCDGSAEPECMRPDLGSSYPVAVFRPFAAAGIKSLAFGLGYQGESPHSFQVSLNRGRGGGYELPPALEGLPGSGQASASLTVPVHLLPWGRGGYLTEACDASSTCEAARGGARLLAQAVSRAATGYFKAPNADSGSYGSSLALSRDGTTLAVGAHDNDSSYAGVFALEDPDYQAALASGGENSSGATYVYRLLSTGRWAIEAFVKAPVADGGDHFGWALALSADGATLAVGSLDDSSHTGAFAPGDPGYQAALASNSESGEESGAVTVYRRSDAGRWTIEAFVKAPRPVDDSYFGVNRASSAQGATVALSADGATLAVGAPGNESGSTGTFVPSDEPGSDYRHAVNNNDAAGSGAAYVYRRSDGDRWTIEAFIKAPFVEITDVFGSAVALSADGSVLAVSAPGEDSSHAGVFVPGGAGYQAALSSNNASGNGAVTVYRRSAAGQWGIEAFVKPLVSSNDEFARFFALSGDGATLAVGAYNEDSGSIGAFAPGDAGYQAALSSGGASNSGAVTVYRRSAAGRWAIEAFVKAPHRVLNSKFGARFGISVDLSSNGVVMAVGSTGENSSFSGVFVPGVEGYQGALDDDSVDSSSAAYVYRRSDTGRWAIEAFVKAPNPGAGDNFGAALALSGDGSTLAVQAPFEDGAALEQPVDGGHIPDSGGASDSGAVYLY